MAIILDCDDLVGGIEVADQAQGAGIEGDEGIDGCRNRHCDRAYRLRCVTRLLRLGHGREAVSVTAIMTGPQQGYAHIA